MSTVNLISEWCFNSCDLHEVAYDFLDDKENFNGKTMKSAIEEYIESQVLHFDGGNVTDWYANKAVDRAAALAGAFGLEEDEFCNYIQMAADTLDDRDDLLGLDDEFDWLAYGNENAEQVAEFLNISLCDFYNKASGAMEAYLNDGFAENKELVAQDLAISILEQAGFKEVEKEKLKELEEKVLNNEIVLTAENARDFMEQ